MVTDLCPDAGHCWQVKAIRVSDVIRREASFMAPGRAPGSDEEVRPERSPVPRGAVRRAADSTMAGPAAGERE